MRICVAPEVVLDTTTHIIENSSEFDIDKVGHAILYNISQQGSDLYCDVCFKGRLKLNQNYDDILYVLEQKNTPYFIVEDNKPKLNREIPVSILFLGSVMKGHIKAQGGVYASSDQGITTYRSSEQEQQMNFRNNLENFGERVVDIDYLMSMDEPDETRTCRNMILEAKKIIKRTLPFYYGFLKNLNEIYLHKKRENDTLAVTPTSMLIFVEYVLSLSIQQLVFDLCHEASHLVFRHSSRIKLRDSNLYNIAGDLIINKALCEEFEITPKRGSDVAEFNNGIYLDDLDLDNETTETLYQELINAQREQMEQQQKQMMQMPNMPGMSGMPQGGQQGQGGQNGSGGGNSKKDPNAFIRHRIRQLYERIKQLSEDPINATMKPLIDKAIAKGKFEERIKALGA